MGTAGHRMGCAGSTASAVPFRDLRAPEIIAIRFPCAGVTIGDRGACRFRVPIRRADLVRAATTCVALSILEAEAEDLPGFRQLLPSTVIPKSQRVTATRSIGPVAGLIFDAVVK